MIKRKLELDREIVTSDRVDEAVDGDAGVAPGPTGCFCSFLCTFECPTQLPDTGGTVVSDVTC